MSEKRGAEELPAFDDPADLVNAVVSTLQVPEEKTTVALTYANDKNAASEVQAYAKIAGRDWTYYVKSLAISIGRNTETGVTPQQQSQMVQIDLGPAKVVSRQHAAITYNIELRCWELKVLGRNGARIDGVKMAVGPGSATPLHSGAILDVGGTQMMFILPDTPPSISQKMLQTCLARYKGKVARPNSAAFFRNPPAAVQHSASSSLGSMFDKTSLSQSPSRAAVSLQNNLDQDLSSEKAKGIKPPYSYATMITQAILSDPEGVMSLSEIYEWISSHYAYYKYSKAGWQNSIRHNLSLNKAFEKVPRKPNEPGKGMKWQISEAYRAEFLKKVQSGTLSKSRRGSSVSRTLQIHLATHQALPDAGGSKEALSRAPVETPPHMQYAVNYPPQHMHQQPYYGYPGVPGPNPGHMQAPLQGGVPNQPHLSQPLQFQNQQFQNQNRMGLMYAMGHQQSPAAPQMSGVLQAPAQIPQKAVSTSVPPKEPDSDSKKRSFSAYKAPSYDENRNSFNSSNGQNTSESIMHNSTAPSTSNTSELGLGFTSPKKIAQLEAFTPERGSKTHTNGRPPTNQSSPAFWNFVQFSTPNGQTPGRRASDDVHGSPTISRGNGKMGLYDDSPSASKKNE